MTMVKVKQKNTQFHLIYTICTKAEAYLEHCQTSKMEISAKTAKSIQSLIVFAKKLYPRSQPGLLIHVIE